MKCMRPLPRAISRAIAGAIGLARLLSALPARAHAPSGRLLASNCFQCHGTHGKGPGFETLAGKSAHELYKEMTEFQSGKEGDNIMARHVMGFSDAQLLALAQWLSTQR